MSDLDAIHARLDRLEQFLSDMAQAQAAAKRATYSVTLQGETFGAAQVRRLIDQIYEDGGVQPQPPIVCCARCSHGHSDPFCPLCGTSVTPPPKK